MRVARRCGRAPLLNLPEMMAHVPNVILDQRTQSDRPIAPDSTLHTGGAIRQLPNDVRQVAVITNPEIDELPPWRMLVALHTDPRVLFIAWEREIASDLGANEPLMIVRG